MLQLQNQPVFDLPLLVKAPTHQRAASSDFKPEPGTVTDLLRKQKGEPGYRRHHNNLGMLYHIGNELVDIMDSKTYGRNSTAIFRKHSRQQALQNSFVPRAVREWNSLSSQVTSAASLVLFFSYLLCCNSEVQPQG